MSDFNRVERSLAIFLRRFPALKVVAKFIFQVVMFVCYRKPYVVKMYQSNLDISEISNEGETFFGYFAQQVGMGRSIVYHSSPNLTNKSPSKYAVDNKSIFVVCNVDGKDVYKSETNAYNWQQGAKLTWVDNNRFIYNDLDVDKNVIAKVVHTKDNGVTVLPYPIYELVNERQYISLGFEALTRLNPDYGYPQIKEKNKLSYIALCDFNGKKEWHYCIDEVNKLLGLDLDPYECCLNHIKVSPNKKDYVMIHRSYPNGVRTDKLLMGCLGEPSASLSIVVDSGMVSHYDWLDDATLICYMRYDGLENYFTIEFGERTIINPISIPGLNSFGDGHPSAVSRSIFITDTYPDKARMKKLIVVNMSIGKAEVIAEFFEPIKLSSQGRCDLHPRYCFESNSIYIDSDHTGGRKLYRLKLGDNYFG